VYPQAYPFQIAETEIHQKQAHTEANVDYILSWFFIDHDCSFAPSNKAKQIEKMYSDIKHFGRKKSRLSGMVLDPVSHLIGATQFFLLSFCCNAESLSA
jgi:hypothetical protein